MPGFIYAIWSQDITKILIAGGGGLMLAVLCAFALIPLLRRLKFGQSILEVGPNWHKSKEGTPTMGGFIFMVAVTIAGCIPLIGWGLRYHMMVLLLAWVFGLIGFVDDFAKMRNKRNQGLTALQKLLLQLTAATAYLSLLRYLGYLSGTLDIPFTELSFEIPWILYLMGGILLITGMNNAVNLTDGIDGLCTGVTLPVSVLFTVLAYESAKFIGLAQLGAAWTGALLGFLIFNFNPAKVFMGDTGSLFLGGMVCGFAFIMDAPLILIVCGTVYILEMFSVMLQVGYFKLTGGKRLFKMAPVHHHFEMKGWKERRVFTVFTLLSAGFCVLAYFGMR